MFHKTRTTKKNRNIFGYLDQISKINWIAHWEKIPTVLREENTKMSNNTDFCIKD